MRRLLTASRLITATIVAALVAPEFGSAETTTAETEHGPIRVETLVTGLTQPVALAFLPDGRMIIAERSTGRISLLEIGSRTWTALAGAPEMLTNAECEVPDGACGLQDLKLHPDFAGNGWVYVCYTEGPAHYSTLVVDRLRLDGTALVDRERLFEADARAEDVYHLGGRMVFAQGHLFLTIGDRHHRDRAQDNTNHAGTILRMTEDGGVPPDNPFVGEEGVLPEIYSFGHRNPQGLVYRPDAGELWSHEHGPAHGDELNRIVAGGNYGWPRVSFGWEYGGGAIGRGLWGEKGMERPIKVWVRAIAPSDLVYYDGAMFPAWRGSFLLGSMSRIHLNRLRIENDQPVLEERILQGTAGRVRALAVDAAGAVYLGADTGHVLRLTPAEGWR